MNQLAALTPLIQAHAAELKTAGVMSIRPGYKMENGWPTQTPAIVVTVQPDAAPLSLPSEIEGVPVDVRNPTAVEQFRAADPDTYARLASQRPELSAEAFPEVDPAPESDEELRAAKTQIDYSGPTGVKLAPIPGKFAITCHASPDAGWPTLRDFLSKTRSKLTVGLYDFTSAHILDAVEGDLSGKHLQLVLDHPAPNPTRDQTDDETVADLDDKIAAGFQQAWALVRSSPKVSTFIYPTAYHIKVAVRDSRAVWLSSGNWNNSNQPDIDPINNAKPADQATARKSDRDWHVVIESAEAARQFEAFLNRDFEVASENQGGERGLEEQPEVPEELRRVAAATFQFHAPLRIEGEELTVTPLLTPDPGVYQPAMLQLIENAQHSLYIQLQYIHPSDKAEDANFTALIDAVAAKIKAGLDVRIICSEFQDGPWLDKLQSAGIPLTHVKIQNGVHNKGFVADAKVVALGSQNWSGDGVLRNRDASVIIENETAAKYFQAIFVHDWERIAKQASAQARQQKGAAV